MVQKTSTRLQQADDKEREQKAEEYGNSAPMHFLVIRLANSCTHMMHVLSLVDEGAIHHVCPHCG